MLADAAQAHGARVDDAGIGALGDAVAWSFYPSKNLGGFADGGCLTSDDPDTIARLRRLRNYGFAGRNEVVEVGANSRLDELQAAFLRVRLAHLDDWNARRATTARRYLDALAELPLALPPRRHDHAAWHLFVVRVADRDRVREDLGARGVETLVHYPVPPFAQPALASLGVGDRAPSRSPNGWRPRCSASPSAPTSGMTARLRWWRRWARCSVGSADEALDAGLRRSSAAGPRRARPSGSQPSSSRARPMSGRRCCGSSTGSAS